MLRYIRLAVVMEALENVELPPYAGSTLRGAFMGALKEVACMSDKPCGDACGWPNACGYGYLCETPVPREAPGRLQASRFAPHPYVITPPEGGLRLAGDLLRFDLTLWGKAPRHLLTVIKALKKMGATGIGRGRRKLRLLRVIDHVSEQPVYAEQNLQLENVSHRTIDIAEPPEETNTLLEVTLKTPLKLQKRGHLLTELDFGELVYAAADRLYLLCHCHGASSMAPRRGQRAKQARAAAVEVIEDETDRVSFRRYSRRQGGHHRLAGLLGRMVFAGELGPFIPCLRAAEIFHLGNGTSFGLGALKVQTESPTTVNKPPPSTSN